MNRKYGHNICLANIGKVKKRNKSQLNLTNYNGSDVDLIHSHVTKTNYIFFN